MLDIKKGSEDYFVNIKNGLERCKNGQIDALCATISDLKSETFDLDSNTNSDIYKDETNDPLNSKVDSVGDDIVNIARAAIGVPYVYGAADYENAMDCSGLVHVCYGQMGIDVPHQTGEIYKSDLFEDVGSIDRLEPGDLIQFGGPNSEGHVGIYTGEGTVVEEPGWDTPEGGNACVERNLTDFINSGRNKFGEPYYLHYKG